MGIWRNIGQIVILLFQIVHEQVKWYIRSFKTSPTKKSNPLNELSRIKKDEILEKYNEELRDIEMVELSEQPFYDIKPE